jgi:uncharacterized membrane protein YjjP (DUF1212 family)/uncharacterized membrane protein YjjB (DUF3815 family)
MLQVVSNRIRSVSAPASYIIDTMEYTKCIDAIVPPLNDEEDRVDSTAGAVENSVVTPDGPMSEEKALPVTSRAVKFHTNMKKSLSDTFLPVYSKAKTTGNTFKSVWFGRSPKRIGEPIDVQIVTNILSRITKALVTYGMQSDHVETITQMIAVTYGIECMIDATTIGLHMTFHYEGVSETRFMKINNGWNVDKLVKLEKLAQDIISRKVSLPDAGIQLDNIVNQVPIYNDLVFQTIGMGIYSVSRAFIINCTWPELVGSFIGGVVCGFLGLILIPRYLTFLGPIRQFLCAILIGFLQFGLRAIFTGYNFQFTVTPALLTSVTFLLPGLTFSIGLSELLRRQVKAGLIRMMNGLISAVHITGALYLIRLLDTAVITTPDADAFVYPYWAKAIIVPFNVFGCMLEIKSPKSPMVVFFIIGASYITYFVTDLLTPIASAHVAIFISTLGAQLVGMIYGLISKRYVPAVVYSSLLQVTPGRLSVNSIIMTIGSNGVGTSSLLVQLFLNALAISFAMLIGEILIPLSHRNEIIQELKKGWIHPFHHKLKKNYFNSTNAVSNNNTLQV